MASKGPKSETNPATAAANTVAATPALAKDTAAKPVAANPVAAKVASAAPVSAKPVAAKPVAAPVAAKVTPPAPVAPADVVAPAEVVAPAAALIAPPVSTPTPLPIDAPAPVAINPSKELNIMENTIKNTAEKTQTMFVEMNDRAKAAMEKTQGLFADVTEFNKGNVEAIVESSKIAAKGIESMGQDAAEYTRKSFENMTAIVKSLSAVKSPTEFMKLHSDYVRTSFDALVAESSKNTEAMLKLAGEIAQPISNRVAVAAEKIKISA